MSAFLRDLRDRDPVSVYLLLTTVTALCFSIAFTVTMIYYVETVGLSPMQLVLVGTTLEATSFLFEIPTGIVADVKSRKLSVIIGKAVSGAAFLLQALVPTYAAVIAAQVVWGIGYTFTSGATEAWLVDEVGQERSASAFLRSSQLGNVASVVGAVVSMAVGSIAVRWPIAVCGAGLGFLALALVWLMREEGFTPVDTSERETWRAALDTLKRASRLAHDRRTVAWLLLAGFILGLYSEGWDRLWMAHLLQVIKLPTWPFNSTVIWVGTLRIVASLVGIGAAALAHRLVDRSEPQRLWRPLMALAGALCLGITAVALTRAFWPAAALYVVIGAIRTVNWPLREAWLNSLIVDPSVRATVLSANGQTNAIGQVVGGPIAGAAASALAIPWGLGVSAVLVSPLAWLYHRLGRSDNSQ